MKNKALPELGKIYALREPFVIKPPFKSSDGDEGYLTTPGLLVKQVKPAQDGAGFTFDMLHTTNEGRSFVTTISIKTKQDFWKIYSLASSE